MGLWPTNRYVRPVTTGLAAGSNDGFGERLAKYLPTELVSIYTIAIGGLISSNPPKSAGPWIALGMIVVFFAATLYFVKKAPAGSVRKAHLVASPIAFVAWAYPLASPLLGAWFIGYVAIIGQALAALAAWLIEAKPQEVKP
jgi:hypothetical protein